MTWLMETNTPSLKGGTYLIAFLLLMNAWRTIVEESKRGWLSNWIWRKLMIKTIGSSLIMFWLGKDSMLCRGNRSMAASLLPTSLLLLVALLKGFFLLNGAWGKEIPFPLSPFLFSLVADSLSQIIIKAESNNLFKGFQVGSDKVIVSHLQYADDTLILMDGDPRFGHMLKLLSSVSIWFPALRSIGLKAIFLGISLPLAEVSFWLIPWDALSKIGPQNIWDYSLGVSSRSRDFCTLIIDRCKSRLATWKANYLPLEEGSLLLKLPSPICLSITYLWLRFPKELHNWKDSKSVSWERQERNKPHLVDWTTVSCPKNDGGLALGGIINRNRALLGKWLWLCPLEHHKLWANVIWSKYGDHFNAWMRLTCSTLLSESLERNFYRCTSFPSPHIFRLRSWWQNPILSRPLGWLIAPLFSFPSFFNLYTLKSEVVSRFLPLLQIGISTFVGTWGILKLLSYPLSFFSFRISTFLRLVLILALGLFLLLCCFPFHPSLLFFRLLLSLLLFPSKRFGFALFLLKFRLSFGTCLGSYAYNRCFSVF